MAELGAGRRRATGVQRHWRRWQVTTAGCNKRLKEVAGLNMFRHAAHFNTFHVATAFNPTLG